MKFQLRAMKTMNLQVLPQNARTQIHSLYISFSFSNFFVFDLFLPMKREREGGVESKELPNSEYWNRFRKKNIFFSFKSIVLNKIYCFI